MVERDRPLVGIAAAAGNAGRQHRTGRAVGDQSLHDRLRHSGERAPGPRRLGSPAPTRRSWLAHRTSPATAPYDQLMRTSSVGFSLGNVLGGRSRPSGGCLRARSSRLLPLVLVLIHHCRNVSVGAASTSRARSQRPTNGGGIGPRCRPSGLLPCGTGASWAFSRCFPSHSTQAAVFMIPCWRGSHSLTP